MMKRHISRLLLICLSVCLLAGVFTSCEKRDETLTLYVYNWGEYISDGSDESVDTNAEFEKYCKEELGITVKVNYSTFASNEIMYAKVSSGSTKYDVIIPSDYMIERMIKASSKEGDVVLDLFSGTGTTALYLQKYQKICTKILFP